MSWIREAFKLGGLATVIVTAVVGAGLGSFAIADMADENDRLRAQMAVPPRPTVIITVPPATPEPSPEPSPSPPNEEHGPATVPPAGATVPALDRGLPDRGGSGGSAAPGVPPSPEPPDPSPVSPDECPSGLLTAQVQLGVGPRVCAMVGTRR